MNAEFMIDTNVLVYAVDQSTENALKKKIAVDLLASIDFGLSAQVLQEFYVTITRKIQKPLSQSQALAFLEKFEVFPLISSSYGLVLQGVRNSIKYQVSYWDGAILAAALELDAKTLYSEDLTDGQLYGTVRVINPFSGLTK